ncbi:MAG: MFS transporter [Burkholderiales bacterium]
MTTTLTLAPGQPAPASARQDATTIGLIGLAHGTSHFFHLLLPPLFPFFIQDFGLSYSELGLLVTMFFIISGTGQAASGFLVDRIGARPVLFAAMFCFVLAALTTALASGYTGLMLAAALAGLGNAPFHPADFTILNKRVSAPRLGHAFSVHGISGSLGWALAPVFLTGLAAWTDSWRVAAACASLVALIVVVVLWINKASIDDRVGQWKDKAPVEPLSQKPIEEHPMAFLKLPSVWLCFSFFFWSTCSLSAIQGFASPALQQLFALPLSITALVVTGYMLCSAAGMLVGGFLVARTEALERVIGVCLLIAAFMLCVVAFGHVPGLLAAGLTALAGFAAGLAGPSRDMLIKRAAPPGATGRVYGTVYSGLDLGFAVAAPVFGYLLDHGSPSWVFYGAALTLALGVVSATLVGLGAAKRQPVHA